MTNEPELEPDGWPTVPNLDTYMLSTFGPEAYEAWKTGQVSRGYLERCFNDTADGAIITDVSDDPPTARKPSRYCNNTVCRRTRPT